MKRKCYLETFNDGGRYWRGRIVGWRGERVLMHFSGWSTRRSLIADMKQWAREKGLAVRAKKA